MPPTSKRARSTATRTIEHSDLPQSQLEVLRGLGADFTERDLGANDPVARYAEIYDQIVDASLTTHQTAELLEVNESRIRQRLTLQPPTLFGIKIGHEWRIPLFQFDERKRLIPNIDRVVSAFSPALPPVDFFLWFTTPTVDLVIAETPVSPKDWLRTGHAVDIIVDMASEI